MNGAGLLFSPIMKLTKIFVLIALVGLCDASSRQKRTLGTILNFFGYKLVPLHGSAGREALADAPVEKYEYPPETPRNPKFMRIQTVMPFRVVEPTPKPTFDFDVRQASTTEDQPEPPIFKMIVKETPQAALEDVQPTEASTTEAAMPSTEATMRPMEASSTSAPLKIILEDMIASTSEQPMEMSEQPQKMSQSQEMSKQPQEMSEQPQEMSEQPRDMFELREMFEQPQPAAPENEQMPATEAISVEPQTDNSINQQQSPMRFNSIAQPNGNNFVQNSQFQPQDVNSLSHDHQFHQFPPQFPAFNQPNPNFEIFKSRDLSDSFIGKPNHFTSFQPQFIQQPQFVAPQPFTHFHDQASFPSNVFSQYSPIQGRNHFSTSRTAMNMNGQAYDFMTHH